MGYFDELVKGFQSNFNQKTVTQQKFCFDLSTVFAVEITSLCLSRTMVLS